MHLRLAAIRHSRPSCGPGHACDQPVLPLALHADSCPPPSAYLHSLLRPIAGRSYRKKWYVLGGAGSGEGKCRFPASRKLYLPLPPHGACSLRLLTCCRPEPLPCPRRRRETIRVLPQNISLKAWLSSVGRGERPGQARRAFQTHSAATSAMHMPLLPIFRLHCTPPSPLTLPLRFPPQQAEMGRDRDSDSDRRHHDAPQTPVRACAPAAPAVLQLEQARAGICIFFF